jgi:hypothetical protein
LIALVRRRDAIVVAGVLAGLAAGLGVALAHPVRHRAEASVIVAPALRRTDPGLATMTRTAASLVRSDAVAQNVVAALHLDESPGHLLGDIGARPRHGTAIVDITVDRASDVEAERIAQQVLVVFQRLADARLGTAGGGPAVRMWDTPGAGTHALGRPFAAWGVGGASVGLLAAAALLLIRPRRRVPAAVQAPEPEPAAQPLSEPPPVAQPEPEQRPAPQPEQEPQPAPETGLVAELRRRVEAEQNPARRAELAVYLEELTPFAAPDGSLPANLLPLVEDVFGFDA